MSWAHSVIGLVAAVTLEHRARIAMHPDLRVFLMVGVCGGFTTFSAFSLQTLELLQAGEVSPAMGLSAGLCRVVTRSGLGRVAARQSHETAFNDHHQLDAIITFHGNVPLIFKRGIIACLEDLAFRDV